MYLKIFTSLKNNEVESFLGYVVRGRKREKEK